MHDGASVTVAAPVTTEVTTDPVPANARRFGRITLDMRQNLPPDSVAVSAEGIMLSGLTGQRFLMVRPEQTADRASRERAERDLLTSLDEETVRRAAARYGVTHVVLDERLREKYGDAARGLGNRGWFEPVFLNSFARILALRKKG